LFSIPILVLDFVVMGRAAPVFAVSAAVSFVGLLAVVRAFWVDLRTSPLATQVVFFLSFVPNGLAIWLLFMLAMQQDGGSPGFAIAPPAHTFLVIWANLAVLRTIQRRTGQFRTLRYAFACAAIAILALVVTGLGLSLLEHSI
jgi:hypothetical protein